MVAPVMLAFIPVMVQLMMVIGVVAIIPSSR
jgi:hypothetical protein